MTALLARYAESVFWMARYTERAENIARVLDVNETFSRDSRGGQNWRSILGLYQDESRFFQQHATPTAEAVIRFYTLDTGNPTSIISALHQARENARAMRPLISTEMWTQINIFYNRLAAQGPADIAEPRLARFCQFVKEGCQTHTGITEGTFYRDEGWHFYQLGRQLERADQTTRLLDTKYHLLLPRSQQPGSGLDVSQWNALLRSVAAYHAFRKVHPRGLVVVDVARFLLHHRPFPRSVAACIEVMQTHLGTLGEHYRVNGAAEPLARVSALQNRLEHDTVDQIIAAGLHEYLDGIQRELVALANDIGRQLFGHPG